MQAIRHEYRRANTLEDAARNWVRGLKIYPDSKSDAPDFYVEDRPDKAIEDLSLRLLDEISAPHPAKLFFSGQRGSGKSTAFLDLMTRPKIAEQYYPFFIFTLKYADPNSLHYTNVLFLMATTLGEYIEKFGNSTSQEILQEKKTWGDYLGYFANLLEVEINLQILKVKLKEPKSKEIIQTEIERDSSKTMNLIERLSLAVEQQEDRKPLLLIDDLDKPPLEKQKEIFSQNRESLFQPACAVVYTFNHSLAYSDDFMLIQDRAIQLPTVRLRASKMSDEPYKEGRNFLRKIVERRMETNLISPDAMEMLIDLSGGLLDQLRQLISDAIRNARLRKAKQVAKEDIQKASEKLRDSFARLLDPKDYELIKRVINSNDRGPSYQRLVDLRAVFEYTNGELWLDVNPVLKSEV